MTYTINQAVDVNDTVDIGNIQVSTNTISSTNTNGNILLSPNGSGNIGIGTSSPDEKLHIGGNLSIDAFGADGNGIYFRDGYNSSSDSYNISLTVKDFRGGTTTTDGLLMSGYYGIGFMTQSNTYSASNVRMYIDLDGLVGVGTNDPKAKLHVNGAGDSGTSLASASRKYIYHSLSGVQSDSTTSGFDATSIYGTHRIVSSSSIISHGSSSYSDTRIKKDIVDIEDDSALQTVRLLKPKKYSYVDTVSKGSEPVWGFIAQEVKSTLDYAVELMEKAIPNVYCNATVVGENYNEIELSNFDTANLQYTEGTLLTKLNCKTWDNREIEVTIEEILSSSKLRLSKPLESNDCNSSDNLIVDTIFVYGQIVSDFHVLKKDAIFIVSVAALQEIDRRQTTDNERILELEGDLAAAQETITSQDQRIVTLEAQVAALLQHTGVTI